MSTNNLIIVAAGGFGREVYTWACQAVCAGSPWIIKGFLEDRPEVLGRFRYNVPILASIESYEPTGNDLFLCAVGEPFVKQRICALLEAKGARFATLIHPTAVIGHEVHIGSGSIIGPLTQLSCDIQIGKHVVFGTNSNTAHDTIIGDYGQVCGSCEINGSAVLEEGVFLGSHATVLPRARVGAWAKVGAGSVVLRRVKPRTTVFGNPAVEIGSLDAAG